MQHLFKNMSGSKKYFLIAGGGLAIFFVFMFGIVIIQKNISDPNTVMLFSEGGAQWIRFPQPTDLFTKNSKGSIYAFRYNFTVREVPPNAILTLRAMKHVALFLDKRLLYLFDTDESNWKIPHHIDLGPFLTPGPHEIYIKIFNITGPPALLAYSQSLGIYTNESWETSKFEETWLPARLLDKIEPSELSRRFKRADAALFENYPLFLTLFFLSVFLTCLFEWRNRYPWLDHFKPSASRIRLLLMILWIIIAMNNIGKIPLHVGMDFDQHLEYIKQIATNFRIPLPTEGRRMFEAPLYYIISALIYKALVGLFSVEVALKGLRIVPLLCGFIQIELCYRALKYVFSEKEDLQIIGTLVGGLLPMNLYMSQVVGTEPLSGVFIGIVVVLLLRLIRYPAYREREVYILIGFFWGLALLTKVTAVLLLAPLIYFVIYTVLPENQPFQKKTGICAMQRVSMVIGIGLLVSGWYYLRNWIEIGKLFVGGWDASRGFLLLQDPGYRSPAQLLRFGEALFYPAFAGVMGFWDALYSTLWFDGFLGGAGTYDYIPPWNYDFMLACVWLSILPTAAIILGLIKTFLRPTQALSRGTLLAASCMAIYFFAILYLFLTVPVYSTAKATYTMGIIPCYAVLCAAGMDMLRQRLYIKALTNGFLVCWAAGAYFSYFVV
ncbi:MAG: hypothetical protein E4H13_12130 [Calditrichales bacterium]|nr:MAG: hypothetical protein E4H13_12130 [Calditrichales bacterium]